jgi:ABC-type protease/lipase transport system fused ATPase/permease subunit
LLSDGLGSVIRQKIRLARAYVQSPSIYLLNQPATDLDPSGQEALTAKLQSLKGDATIVISSSHERILALADRTVNISAGRAAASALPASGGASLTPRGGTGGPRSLQRLEE